MNRKVLNIAIAVLAAILIVVVIIIKKGKSERGRINPEFSKYIDAYSSGVLSKKATIKVRLTDKVVEQVNKTEETIKDVFKFEPSVSGTAIWADANTIEFKPEKDLISDKTYNVEFNLEKLIDVPSEFEEFEFNFKVVKQNFEVTIDEIKTTDKKTFKLEKILGNVQTSDIDDLKNISKILDASQEGKSLKVKWTAGPDGLFWQFEIDSVVRSDKSSKALIKWHGEAIGVEKTGDTIMEIPSLGEFKYMFNKVIQSPEQYLQLQFSDPLMVNQVLNGLITIKDIYGMNFVVEDNTIRVYPPKHLAGNYPVTIEEGISNVNGKKLKKTEKFNVFFEDVKPAVRFCDKGVILPESDKGMIVPFEAVNLKAVDVKITKIYENNITQFLQSNDYSGYYELKRVAKAIVKKTIRLDQSNVVNLGKWTRFTLDLNKMIKADPGAMYRISIGFRKQYSLYSCNGDTTTSKTSTDLEQTYEGGEGEGEGYGGEYFNPEYYGEDYYWDNFGEGYYGYYYGHWEDRDNPCKDAYYGGNRIVSKNILASNLGLISKRANDGSIKIFVTDIRTTKPLSNVTVEILDFQKQVLATGTTNSDGLADFANIKEAYFLVAKLDKQKGYLKLNDGASLSLSRFDVSGVSVNKGMKGFIYGERGVWRPGDSLFLTFILEENAEKLPDNHPVVFELKNPQYQLVKRIVDHKNPTGFYTFKACTSPDAPTGNWEAKVTIGGVNFTKSLKIENIKPNRLKINLDFGREFLAKNINATAKINAKWLHGAPARNMQTTVNVILSPVRTYFEKFKNYEFDDPSKKFFTESTTIFDGETDEEGNASFVPKINVDESAPGKLNANFITKVFENGGNFSIDQFSLPYYAYKSFVGMKTPKGEKSMGMLFTDTTHVIEIITVDEKGNVVGENHNVEMEFYHMEWRWWWDRSDDELTNYTGRSYIKPLKKEKIKTSGGKAAWSVRINYPDWGRYLVRAHDLTSGHSSATIMYLDWPGWIKREQKDHAGGATMLSFTTDKEKYKIGEKVNLTIPTGKGGRALVSIESGTKVVETYWVETEQGQTQFSFTANEKMAPNVYINVTLLQPHAQCLNDLPVRMYGIMPITVENPETHLEPVLNMADELRAEAPATIKVKEKTGKAMTYTLAIVDDGLLDLTHFKTPDPWNNFYAKEALGVLTWDIFDWVIGAYGGELERLLSIGGDGSEAGGKGKKANRFKPMVRFIGPIELKSGLENTHIIQMPQYIGSVRTMVIAGKEKAYGFAEKTTPVTKPLMLLGTLPRVLGPGETVKLPVTVFAMKDDIKDVTVTVTVNNLLTLQGGKTKSLKFLKKGDQNIDFDLKVNPGLGIAKVKIEAVSGNEKAAYDIELDVRNPNPKVTDVMAKVLEAGETWDTDFKPVGIQGTNKGTLEVSSIPPVNMGERLKFLIAYPHGCVEQTTSAVFPQLYLSDVMELSKDKKEDISRNIKAGIQRLSKFQMENGGLAYWQGGNDVCEWGTNYAGHFLIEAEKKGYIVPSELLKKWVSYQTTKARNWTDDGNHSQLIQAYRLYTLALAEKPEIGAMNRLREKSKLSDDTKWRLAAAYQLTGKNKIALELVYNLNTNVQKYCEMDYTFGSDVRDKAMILETLSLLDMRKKAFDLLKEISDELSKNTWMSTQTTAYSLIAVSKFVSKNMTSQQLSFSYKFNGGNIESKTSRNSVYQVDVPIKTTANSKLNVKNTSKGIMYARLILEGIPEVGETTDSENDLRMTIIYKTLEGVPVNIDKMPMGKDFMAEVTIQHPGIKREYKQLALTQIFPSGWEIINSRMLDAGSAMDVSVPTYQDIKDDRVYTYFDLWKGRSKTFRIMLNASYCGRYYLPTVYAEAMYDNTINSRKHGRWVEVVKE